MIVYAINNIHYLFCRHSIKKLLPFKSAKITETYMLTNLHSLLQNLNIKLYIKGNPVNIRYHQLSREDQPKSSRWQKLQNFQMSLRALHLSTKVFTEGFLLTFDIMLPNLAYVCVQ